MNLQSFLFLNEDNIIRAAKVQFSPIDTKLGKAMSFTSDGKKYIIAASLLKDYNRFKKWDGKKATADFLPLKKKVKTDDGDLPLVKIRTDVEVENEKENNNKETEKDDQGDIIF